MISGTWKRHLWKKNRDKNKGAALVMVIVSLAFIGMLVAMILYMAYSNYIMKGTDKRAKDNFYSAEYALDVINAGIQADISAEMSKAYVNTIQNSEGQSENEMANIFRQYFKNYMYEKVKNPTISNEWSKTYLTDMWSTQSIFSVAGDVGDTPTGTYLGIAYLGADDNELFVSPDGSYMDLKNVKITYTDRNGYVSIIETDIRITTPDLNFAQTASHLSVEQFSIIANEEFLNINDENKFTQRTGLTLPESHPILGSQKVAVTGNVFGGYSGIFVENQRGINFENDSKDAPTNPGEEQTKTYLLAAKGMYLNNCKNNGSEITKGLSTENYFRTYVEDIDVKTADLNLNGETYVADDLEISGKNSKITLEGVYKGYGNAKSAAKGSSSILINGVDTTLDFSGLKILSLAGHAYVGATKYDADRARQEAASTAGGHTLEPGELDTDKYSSWYDSSKADDYDDDMQNSAQAPATTVYPQNKTDVMTGQAIAVKAEQLLYMVPDECVGYDKETGGQYIAKNPMTYDEYTKLLTTPSTTLTEKNIDGTEKKDANGQPVYQNRYEVVRLANLWNSMGNAEYTPKNADGTDKYKAVFRRVSGTVMVYLYLDFGGNDNMANQFYRAYYDSQPDKISNYVKSYVNNITFSPELVANDDTSLNLAGNAFYLDGEKNVVFQNDTTDSPLKANRIYEEADKIAQQHTAAMHSLQTNYDLMTAEQESNKIFNYLVPESAKRDVLPKLEGKILTDGAATGAVYAIVSNKDVVYNGAPGTHLIITDKDVYLNADMVGLVIAGGRIFICSDCENVTYDPELAVRALKTHCTVNDAGVDKEVYAYEALGPNGVISYGMATSTGGVDVSIRDLITYQNWKKE